MYNIEFLPIAKKDIDDVVYYVSHNLKNITAARKLRNLFINSFDKILKFPYGCAVYQPIGTLKNEYRSYRVKNFLLFYIVDEEQKLITIVRVLHQKMDISNILE